MVDSPGGGQGKKDTSFDKQIRDALSRSLKQEEGGEAAAGGARTRVMAGVKPRLSMLRQGLAGILGHVSRKGIYDFCRELAILLECGMPMVRALNTLASRISNFRMARIAQSMGAAIEEGSSFSDAVAEHQRSFPGLAVNMIRAGEASGNLTNTLYRIADQGDRMESAKAKAVTAMIYPIAVFLVAGAVIAFAFSFLVNQFVEDLGKDITPTPLMSLMINLGLMFKSWQFWIWLVVIIVLVVIAYLIARRFATFRLIRDRILLHVPLARLFIRESLVAHFSRVFSMLLESGVPLIEAIEASRGTTGNEVMRLTLDRVADAVREGRQIAPEFDKSGVFPVLVCDTIAVGEEAGSLDRVFARLGDVHEKRLEEYTARLSALVQPVIVIVLALVVGVVALTLFGFYAQVLQNLGASPAGL